MVVQFLLAIFLLFAAETISQSLRNPSFSDVTTETGLLQFGPQFKFGGPCVVDLDNDGIYDIILTNHNSAPLQLFFGTAQGTFEKSSFTFFTDIHGVAAAQRSATSRNRIFAVSVGGARGSLPRAPFIFQVTPQREITNVTSQLGFGEGKGRGRVALFMDLALQTREQKRANSGGPDVLFINFLGAPQTPELKEFAYRNVGGQYALSTVPGIENELESRAEVVDIDGDGRMEVVSFRDFQIYKLVGPFQFVDATAEFIPNNPIPLHGRSIASVVEIDYDNDGDFDLYVARTNNTLISHLLPIDDDFSDFLLENRDGILVDVSREAGIPTGTFTMGVTAGDYNNDGFIDLMLSYWDRPDVILFNLGDKRFRIGRDLLGGAEEVGDHAVAVDYNMDGRLDLIVGRGSMETDSLRGIFHVFMNTMPMASDTNFLLVRVQNDPTRAATSLHAIVTVFLEDGMIVRRVGGSGAQAGGPSYLDTVHFGLGAATTIKRVRVRWSSGVARIKRNVAVNQKITFGVQ